MGDPVADRSVGCTFGEGREMKLVFDTLVTVVFLYFLYLSYPLMERVAFRIGRWVGKFFGRFKEE